MEDRLVEHIVSRETIMRGAIFDLERLQVTLPNGAAAQRDVVRHKGAAAVLPLDESGNVLLVRQYRVAVDRVVLEIPAGKLDAANENPLHCAHRELKEETGLRAGSMQFLTAIDTTVGFTDERIHLFLATQLVQEEATPDEDEFLGHVAMPLPELMDRIVSGEIADAKTIVAAFMTWQRLTGGTTQTFLKEA